MRVSVQQSKWNDTEQWCSPASKLPAILLPTSSFSAGYPQPFPLNVLKTRIVWSFSSLLVHMICFVCLLHFSVLTTGKLTKKFYPQEISVLVVGNGQSGSTLLLLPFAHVPRVISAGLVAWRRGSFPTPPSQNPRRVTFPWWNTLLRWKPQQKPSKGHAHFKYTQKTIRGEKKSLGKKSQDPLPGSPCWRPLLDKCLSEPTPDPLSTYTHVISPPISSNILEKWWEKEHMKSWRTPASALNVLMFPWIIEYFCRSKRLPSSSNMKKSTPEPNPQKKSLFPIVNHGDLMRLWVRSIRRKNCTKNQHHSEGATCITAVFKSCWRDCCRWALGAHRQSWHDHWTLRDFSTSWRCRQQLTDSHVTRRRWLGWFINRSLSRNVMEIVLCISARISHISFEKDRATKERTTRRIRDRMSLETWLVFQIKYSIIHHHHARYHRYQSEIILSIFVNHQLMTDRNW